MNFRLRDVEYAIKRAKVELIKEDNGIRMNIEILAETSDESVDYEMRELQLYNEGFNTKVQNIEQLKEKAFAWKRSMNNEGEEAGILNVVEFENVTKGTIEIVDIDEKNITIHWSGEGNIYWNELYSKNVPFNTEFTVEYIMK